MNPRQLTSFLLPAILIPLAVQLFSSCATDPTGGAGVGADRARSISESSEEPDVGTVSDSEEGDPPGDSQRSPGASEITQSDSPDSVALSAETRQPSLAATASEEATAATESGADSDHDFHASAIEGHTPEAEQPGVAPQTAPVSSGGENVSDGTISATAVASPDELATLEAPQRGDAGDLTDTSAPETPISDEGEGFQSLPEDPEASPDLPAPENDSPIDSTSEPRRVEGVASEHVDASGETAADVTDHPAGPSTEPDISVAATRSSGDPEPSTMAGPARSEGAPASTVDSSQSSDRSDLDPTSISSADGAEGNRIASRPDPPGERTPNAERAPGDSQPEPPAPLSFVSSAGTESLLTTGVGGDSKGTGDLTEAAGSTRPESADDSANLPSLGSSDESGPSEETTMLAGSVDPPRGERNDIPVPINRLEPTDVPEIAARPMSRPNVESLAIEQLPPRFLTIVDGGSLVAVHTDFDSDGLTDVAILTAEPIAESPGSDSTSDESDPATSPNGATEDDAGPVGGRAAITATVSESGPQFGDRELVVDRVRDPARLFSTQADSYTFRLHTYLQRGPGVELYSEDLLGSFVVFGSLDFVAFSQGRSVPGAISATFQTRRGSVSEWVVFSASGVSRLTLRDRIGSSSRVEDIDGDGIVDIVLSDENFEVGTGYETYLSWLRWNGSGFELFDSANIIRSLSGFLAESLETLKSGDHERFLRYVSDAPRGEDGGNADGDRFDGQSEVALRDRVFEEVFRLVPSPSGFANRAIEPDETITRIVHPQILENPFSQEDAAGAFFPLRLRIETSTGGVHLYAARLYISKNPFEDRQFYFAPSARR